MKKFKRRDVDKVFMMEDDIHSCVLEALYIFPYLTIKCEYYHALMLHSVHLIVPQSVSPCAQGKLNFLIQ